MISFRTILNYVIAEPFRPFRITTTNGHNYEIRDPEMVQVGRSTMTIYDYLSSESEETKVQKIEVPLLLTESVEPLDAAPRPQGA